MDGTGTLSNSTKFPVKLRANQRCAPHFEGPVVALAVILVVLLGNGLVGQQEFAEFGNPDVNSGVNTAGIANARQADAGGTTAPLVGSRPTDPRPTDPVPAATNPKSAYLDTRRRTDNDFEGPDTSWRIVRSDCRLQTLRHERTHHERHQGGQSERITIRAGNGTYVYAAHEIAPCRVIAELTPRIWLKSDRNEIQLLARVVYPHARDQLGQPVTALIRGDFYQTTGRWQSLSIPQLELAVQRRTRALRAELQIPFDDNGAYIDLLVLNLYGDAGTANVWIDDLSIEGVVHARVEVAPVDMAAVDDGTPQSTQWPNTKQPWAIENGQLVLQGRTFFARVALHRNEPFDRLQQLGFNTIWLSDLATPEQLRAARLAGLWLVCPPPAIEPSVDSVEIGTNWDQYHRVLAWDVSGPSGANASLARRMRKADTSQRPLIARLVNPPRSEDDPSTLEQRFAHAVGVVDIVVPPTAWDNERFDEASGSSASWSRMSRVSAEQRKLLIWQPISLDPSSTLQEMLKTVAVSYELPAPRVHYVDARNELYRTFLGNGNGVCMLANSSWQGKDEVADYRRAVVELLNHEAAVIAPWAMNGDVQPIFDVAHQPVAGRAYLTARSQLLLIDSPLLMRQDSTNTLGPAVARITRGPLNNSPLAEFADGARTIVLPAVEAVQVYVVNQHRLSPLPSRRVPGGVEFRVSAGGDVTALLLLQDALIVERISQKLRALQPRTARLLFEIVSDEALTMHQVHSRLRREVMTSPEIDQLRAQLKKLHDQAHASLQAHDFVTTEHAATRALSLAQQMRQMTRDEMVRPDRYQASPFLRHFETYPLQVFLSSFHRGLQLTPRDFRQHRFENLEEMVAGGWHQKLKIQPSTNASVGLVAVAPHQGQFCMQLSISERLSMPGSAATSDNVVDNSLDSATVDSAEVEPKDAVKDTIAGHSVAMQGPEKFTRVATVGYERRPHEAPGNAQQIAANNHPAAFREVLVMTPVKRPQPDVATIQSPRVNVREGDVIRIRGWWRHQQLGSRAQSRLGIYDTNGHSLLDQRLTNVADWEQFEWLHVASRTELWGFEIRAEGQTELSMDDLIVEILGG